MTEEAIPDFSEARRRFRSGEWRARVFRDLVLGSILDQTEKGEPVVALDIGCGRGIEDSKSLQASLAEAADRLVGVEPDEGMEAPACFEAVHRTILEEAPIPAASIRVAYSYFVLEHVENPGSFFRALHDVLVPGGVFWGCTMDRRHLFSAASTLLERLGWKDRYLDRLQGTKGEERYENYPTWYRANSPEQIARHAAAFGASSVESMGRVGQLDFYLPERLRPLGHLLDRTEMGLGLPGSVLFVWLRK